jgi:hypothetical protein
VTTNESGPRRGRPDDRLPRPHVTRMLRHGGDDVRDPGARSCCPACGQPDPLTALHLLLAERREAWIDGQMEAFANGWDQRGAYEAERGAA